MFTCHVSILRLSSRAVHLPAHALEADPHWATILKVWIAASLIV